MAKHKKCQQAFRRDKGNPWNVLADAGRIEECDGLCDFIEPAGAIVMI